MKRYLIASTILMACIQTGFSAECQFSQPTINTDVCQTLNLDNKVINNPFFMKNQNGLCGMDLHLSGLPDLSIKDYIPNFNVDASVCGALKYVNGGKLVSQINKFLHF